MFNYYRGFIKKFFKPNCIAFIFYMCIVTYPHTVLSFFNPSSAALRVPLASSKSSNSPKPGTTHYRSGYRQIKALTQSLVPGQLLHQVSTSRDEIGDALDILAHEGFSEGGAPRWYPEHAFSFHVTDTEVRLPFLDKRGSFGLFDEERLILLIFTDSLIERMTASNIFSDEEIIDVITGTKIVGSELKGMDDQGRSFANKAIQLMARKGIRFPQNIPIWNTDFVIRQLFHTILVSRFYECYRRTGKKNYCCRR